MTNLHPGDPTYPLRRGAPLPPDPPGLPRLQQQDINEELNRAGTELLYALARHRKAWARFRSWAEKRDADAGKPGAVSAIDSDPVWQNRSSDVSWWRGEVTCQSTAILALKALNESVAPKPRATIIFGWEVGGSQAPTERQYRTACAWRDGMQDGRLYSTAEVEAVEQLIARYELAHPIPRR